MTRMEVSLGLLYNKNCPMLLAQRIAIAAAGRRYISSYWTKKEMVYKRISDIQDRLYLGSSETNAPKMLYEEYKALTSARERATMMLKMSARRLVAYDTMCESSRPYPLSVESMRSKVPSRALR